MKTSSTEVTLIWRRNDIEKSTWKTHQYFVNFESQIHVEISTSNRCNSFHVDSPFKIDEISTNIPRGISTSNRWQIDEDMSVETQFNCIKDCDNKMDQSKWFIGCTLFHQKNIIFKTPMLRSELCDYSNVYIVANGQTDHGTIIRREITWKKIPL